MPLYAVLLFVLVVVTLAVCAMANRRLAFAALSLALGFASMVFAYMALEWREPQILLLASCVDLVALMLIGRAIEGRTWPSGVHLAGVCMCVSLVAHPAYYLAANDTTLAYYLMTNIAMAVACLGLIGSGTAEVIARHARTFDFDFGGASGSVGVATRREGE